MKSKFFLLLIYLLILIRPTQAQINVGLKAGINYVNNELVNPPPDYVTPNSYRFGYHFGLFTNIKLADRFSLNPELAFSNKGSRYDLDPTIRIANIHLNYLNLPILIEYELLDKLSVEIGPELGYLLSAKAKTKTDTQDIKNIWDNDIDIGLSAGLKYQLLDKWIIGIRYSHGFSSVMKNITFYDENGNPLDDNKMQNRAFQLSVGYRIK